MSEQATGGDVRLQVRGAVHWITIDREARRNALNERVVARISEGIAAAVADANCRAIVLTGSGTRAFCAGADLNKNVQGGAFEVDFSRPHHYLVALFRQMQSCPLPIVARVNGAAMAGGFGLLCACDMAVSTDDASFATPESKIGLTPMMILPSMLRVVPQRKLMEMCVTGEPYTAAEALALGIVNHVVPRAELDAKLEWLLARMIDRSPTAVRLGKQAFQAMRDMAMFEALEYAQAMVPVMASTEDAREGLAAFQEKRPPIWTGR